MPRQADTTRLSTLRQAIETHSGERASFFARLLDLPRETISRMLVTLNDNGVLLYEDEQGKLWPFNDGEQPQF